MAKAYYKHNTPILYGAAASPDAPVRVADKAAAESAATTVLVVLVCSDLTAVMQIVVAVGKPWVAGYETHSVVFRNCTVTVTVQRVLLVFAAVLDVSVAVEEFAVAGNAAYSIFTPKLSAESLGGLFATVVHTPVAVCEILVAFGDAAYTIIACKCCIGTGNTTAWGATSAVFYPCCYDAVITALCSAACTCDTSAEFACFLCIALGIFAASAKQSVVRDIDTKASAHGFPFSADIDTAVVAILTGRTPLACIATVVSIACSVFAFPSAVLQRFLTFVGLYTPVITNLIGRATHVAITAILGIVRGNIHAGSVANGQPAR